MELGWAGLWGWGWAVAVIYTLLYSYDGTPLSPCPPILEANKVEIVREGAVPPLLRLSHSSDLKVQRNAAGALLNLTHIGQRSCLYSKIKLLS